MNRDELKRYAALKGIPLGVAEKDYVLSVVLMQLSKSQYAKKFIFKGGTAVKKAYFPDARFSVDLDFNFFDISGDKLIKDLSGLFDGKTLLNVAFQESRYKEITENKALMRLEYKAQMNHLDNVRLDFTLREPVLTNPGWWTLKDDFDVARRMTCEHLIVREVDVGGYVDQLYACKLGRMERGLINSRRACLDCKMEAPRRIGTLPSAFRVMTLEEILSEKVRACLTRGRPRDLYDVWFLLSRGVPLDRDMIVDKLRLFREFREKVPSLNEIRELLEQIEPEWSRDLRALVPSKTHPIFQEILETVIISLKNSGWRG